MPTGKLKHKRTRQVKVAFTVDELTALTLAARAAGLSVAAYLREAALRRAAADNGKSGV